MTKKELEILDHTMNRAARRMFYGSSEEMNELVKKGYMKFVGRVGWCPDAYYTITKEGIEALQRGRDDSE